MRIVLVDPHTQPIAQSLAGWLVRRRSIDKYRFLLDQIIAHPKRPTAFLITGHRSSFTNIGLPQKLVSRPLATIELYLWLLLHGLNPFHCQVFYHHSQLNPAHDVLFMFAKTTLRGDHPPPDIISYPGLTVIHLTHYFLDTKNIAQHAQQIPHPIFLAESNLVQNDFFHHHFPFVNQVNIVPFAVKPRYQMTTQLSDRLNKCFAIGTLFKADSPDFLSFFGSRPFHPMRQAIYDQHQSYPDQIASFITKHDDSPNARRIDPKDTSFIKFAKKHLPFFLVEKIIPSHQKKYYSFDIVDKYNEFRMFVSPEEIVGLPSINVAEGMACGAAFIGPAHSMHTNVGLKPDFHYISYQQNSLTDLIATIKYYQQRPKQLSSIAHRGQDFTLRNFSPDKVANTLWDLLLKHLPSADASSATSSPT